MKHVLVTFCLVFFCACAFAEEDKVEVSFNSDFFSKYIWRGQKVNDEPVFQPSVSVGYKGLTASIWGNMDLTNIYGNAGDFSEIDFCLEYGGETGIEGIGYLVGVTHYAYPNTKFPGTSEVYVGLDVNLPLNPSIKLYRDVDETEGTYISFAVGHQVEEFAKLGETPVGLDIGASLGWANNAYNKCYWEVGGGKLNDLTLRVSFPVKIVDWTLTPSLNYVTLVDSKIRESDACSTESDFFFVGLSLSKSF